MSAPLRVLATLMLAVQLLGVAGGFADAGRPWHFVFPRDSGAHNQFATEWWYFTGHLRARDGRRFGYELTIFRAGLRPGDAPPRPGQSAWRGNELFPAHFAITDERGKTFVYHEQFAREALGDGHAATGRLDVKSGTWTIAGDGPIRLHAAAGGHAIDFVLRSEKPPAIHGHDGVSRKGPCESCASHYYSLTRLATIGTLRFGGTAFAVDGISWMDHEFGSDELQDGMVGWDWFSLQLNDGRELMLYLLRLKNGGITPQSSGSLIARDGKLTYLPRTAFTVTPTGWWASPHTGGRYPSGWHVQSQAAGIDLELTPTVADQELAAPEGGVSYWEGSVNVIDARSRATRGVGYVELTGYAGALRL